EPFMTVRHEYTHFKITLYSFQCRFDGGTPKPRNAIDWTWVRPEEMEKFAFPKANKKILAALLDDQSADFKSAS
ncbi:MAG: NUDIX domain-containing protein, partial [bacterium]